MVPTEIGSLTSLTYLDLRHNLFNCGLPVEVVSLQDEGLIVDFYPQNPNKPPSHNDDNDESVSCLEGRHIYEQQPKLDEVVYHRFR